MAKKNFILVCGGTGCESAKGDEIYRNLIKEAELQGVKDDVQIVKTGCFGFCEQGPIVKVLPTDSFYVQVKPADAKEIIAEQVIKGREVQRLLYKKDKKAQDNVKVQDIEFYQKQFRIVLRNCGVINPENIEEYIARDGYMALEKCLFELKPQQIIDIMKASGLRGRGGAGFPTGQKWKFARAPQSDKKYIICNADEGDPGAFMDRSILEGDPHSVIEGLIIGGYAIGADEGYIYCRAEYPIAIKRLNIAIKQATERGFLGENIMGTGFNFKIKIKEGAGAFVCGEETALIASIEGQRGMPRMRPPYPANKGLFAKPSNINNVETYANVGWIIRNGADAFAAYGTAKSKGTKVFALAGKIARGGLVEVPIGMPLKEVIFDIGGGTASGKPFKAVQMGGPSGGCIPASLTDTIIDYDELNATGAIMGSGGMIVMDEDNCMVDIARYFLNFIQSESCGKCTYCRIGTKRMLEILTRITEGKGEEGDIDKLLELAEQIKKNSLCGLGQTSPNPVLTTLRYFREEYEAHIRDKKCPAKQCKALIKFTIDPEKCVGCTMCAKNCPVKCISGSVKKPHEIDQALCTKCGTCKSVCKFGAISVD